MISFISYKTAMEDTLKLNLVLPGDICAIVGVPRSGMLPATILGTTRNLPVFTVSELLKIWPDGVVQHRSRRTPVGGAKVLVVDDSISKGRQLGIVREQLKDAGIEAYYSALYASARAAFGVDIYHRVVPHPRIFQWNMWRHPKIGKSVFDLDGVLCLDPEVREDDEEAYLDFLENATPRYIPTMKIRGICTARLEKHRARTEEWLERNGVVYGFLDMAPYDTPQERRRVRRETERRKARVSNEHGAFMFLESSVRQARRISKYTDRPVLCTDNMTLYGGLG